MQRPSAFAVLLTVFCAFVVMAAHLGTIDHSIDMTGSDMRTAVSTATGMPAALTLVDSARPLNSHRVTQSPAPMPVRRPASGGMTMVMVCELMVLVTILGVALRRLLNVGRVAAIAATVRRPLPTRPSRRLRPLRPPGLSILCVVRC